MSHKDNNNKKSKKQKKNKDAINFALGNRDFQDPNFNNPSVSEKILVPLDKDEELTQSQKDLINKIPKESRGLYDEEDLLDQKIKNENNDTNKKVKFSFNKSEIIKFRQDEKISEPNKKDEEKEEEEDKKIKPIINNNNSNKGEKSKYENDEKYIDELFKRIKVNAKIVEYNELGVPKDTDPEILKYLTNKPFKEGEDIFIPPSVFNKENLVTYDNDMKEEDMNDEYKAVEEQLKSDSEDDNNINTDNKDKKDDELEDNFILLANEGELPIEFINKKNEDNQEDNDNVICTSKNNMSNSDNKNISGSYKYISKEELEFVKQKFNEMEQKKHINDNNGGKYKRIKGYVGKEEFDDAINEMLNYKKDDKNDINNNISTNNSKNKKKNKKTIHGLTKKLEDEKEFEEYESLDEEDLYKMDQIEPKQDEEEEEEEEEEDEGYVPNIKIEYVDKNEEPDPFEKDNKKDKNKKDTKEKKKNKNPKNDDKDKEGDKNKKEEEIFNLKDLNKLTEDKDLINKILELYEKNEQEEQQNYNDINNIKKIENDIEKYYIHNPKIKKDINDKEFKIKNLPKSIGNENKQSHKLSNEKNDNEDGKNKNNKEKESDDKDDNQESKSNNNFIRKKGETKEERKLRKNLIKLERKEKRIENKKLKLAFKQEKKVQEKQIAESNKVIRSGLSVKDI